MSAQAHFMLNGKAQLLPDDCLNTSVLEYLRELALVGSKEGCGDGDCGACTVVVLGKNAQAQPEYQAVNSCLIPLAALAGKELLTVEGLGAKLHPVQEAMIKTGGSQCGYCTPGFIMSMFAAYYANERNDIAIEGNLCRCTGYVPIREALRSLGEVDKGDSFFLALTTKAVNVQVAEENLAFSNSSFYQPATLAEVFSLLEHYPGASLIAGGTDLGLEISNKTRSFETLISLEQVAELQTLSNTSEVLELGAALPLSHIEKTCRGLFPALDEMIHWFAARQIRNRATIGGNLGTASPIGDLAPVLLALDAVITLASKSGERRLALADYFVAYRQTLREANEVIVSVIIPKSLPKTASKRHSFAYKVGKRGTDDISIVAAAFCIDLDSEARVVQARLAYGGVAATPVRALGVENWLIGKVWNHATVLEAKSQLAGSFSPISDFRGSADYRKRLIANLFEKFFWQFTTEVLS